MMDQKTWSSLSPEARDKVRDLSGLTPCLLGREGWRVEVVDCYGKTRRFIVGRSDGCRPCHIEVSRRSAFGGPAASMEYESVRNLYRVR